MFGFWKYWNTARVTFVIDATGTIEQIIDMVKTKNHAAQILESRSSEVAKHHRNAIPNNPMPQQPCHAAKGP